MRIQVVYGEFVLFLIFSVNRFRIFFADKLSYDSSNMELEEDVDSLVAVAAAAVTVAYLVQGRRLHTRRRRTRR